MLKQSEITGTDKKVESTQPHVATIKSEANFQAELKQYPLNSDIHYQYSIYCLSNNNDTLAIAEFKTAISLDMNAPEVQELIDAVQNNAPPLTKKYSSHTIEASH